MRLDPELSALLAPVHDVLSEGLARLDANLDAVGFGAVDGWWVRRPEGVVLSSGLLGPGIFAAGEPEGPHALDRWRRAAAALLEAAASARVAPGGPTWLREGLCIHLADRAAPSLRLVEADLWLAAVRAPGVWPRSGVAVLRAWEAAGRDAEALAREALATGRVPMPDFLEAGRWVLGAGLAAAVPGAPQPDAADVPLALLPWSWARLAVPAHPRGGRIRVEGRGGVRPAWAVGGVSFEGLAASGEGGARLVPEPGGPVGDWELRSAEGFGQIFGARGLQFTFRPGGRLDVVLADAFVGPIAAVEASARVGTSGTATGRWQIEGPRTLSLHDLVPEGMSVHGRGGRAFVLPAEGFGLGEQLRGMEGTPWRFDVEGERLVLDGQMYGSRVRIRLAPAAGNAAAALAALGADP